MNKLLTLLIGSIVTFAPVSVKAQDILSTAIKFGSLQLSYYREYGRFAYDISQLPSSLPSSFNYLISNNTASGTQHNYILPTDGSNGYIIALMVDDGVMAIACEHEGIKGTTINPELQKHMGLYIHLVSSRIKMSNAFGLPTQSLDLQGCQDVSEQVVNFAL